MSDSVRGIVFIAADLSAIDGEPAFVGYWESDNPRGVLEQGPGWVDVEEAIAWGRARAPIVLVRLGATDDSIYSAGLERAPRTKEPAATEDTFPEWPPTPTS